MIESKSSPQRSEEYRAYHREYAKNWYRVHKERMLGLSKEWVRTHPGSIIKTKQKYYQAHRDQVIKKATEWNQSEKGRASRLEHARKIKLDVMTYYGGGMAKCVLCGHAKLTSLSIDHVNGGGCKHRKDLSIKSLGFYVWLIKNNYPEGFRTLCLNCQFDERARILEEKRKKRL